MRRADGAVETRQPAVAQPAGCRVSIKHGATWGSRGELRCPLQRALQRARVLTDDVHRASCVPQQPLPDPSSMAHMTWLTGRAIIMASSHDRGRWWRKLRPRGEVRSTLVAFLRAIWRRWRLHVPVAAICRRGLIFGCRGFGFEAAGNAPNAKLAVASGASRILGRSCACACTVRLVRLSRDELAPVDRC